jgi:hypothetical protein
MTTATRPKQTTQELTKPIICQKCQAAHFSHQLTCKRCGDFLDKRDSVVSESNMGAVKLGLGAACVLICLFTACLIFHVL